jgi:hypothetical protein
MVLYVLVVTHGYWPSVDEEKNLNRRIIILETGM